MAVQTQPEGAGVRKVKAGAERELPEEVGWSRGHARHCKRCPQVQDDLSMPAWSCCIDKTEVGDREPAAGRMVSASRL